MGAIRKRGKNYIITFYDATGKRRWETVGPNLHGVFGRKAGSLDGYAYSAAMKNSGIVWDDETLAKYLRDPRGSMPGNKMAFPGIKNDEELANLLAYLHQATQ